MAISEASETENQQEMQITVTRKERLQSAALLVGGVLLTGTGLTGAVILQDHSPEEAYTSKYVDNSACLDGTPYDPIYHPKFSTEHKAGHWVLTVDPQIVTFIDDDQPNISFTVEDNWRGSAEITGIAEQDAAQTEEVLSFWGC